MVTGDAWGSRPFCLEHCAHPLEELLVRYNSPKLGRAPSPGRRRGRSSTGPGVRSLDDAAVVVTSIALCI